MYPLVVFAVFGEKSQVVLQRGRRNSQVELADGLSDAQEPCVLRAPTVGRRLAEGPDGDSPEEALERLFPLRLVAKPLDQFRYVISPAFVRA